MIISRSLIEAAAEFRILVGRALTRFCGGFDGDFYINGPDTLPPPLTAEEEADIIARLEDDRSLCSVLVERNLRLVVYIAKKFENTRAGIEDLISIGTIGLIKAANTYKAEKNIKFATYGSRCIENEILMFIRKNSGARIEQSIDEPLNIDWDGNELLLSDVLGTDADSIGQKLEREEEERALRDAIAGLPERERVIIELRYGFGGSRALTQKEVADLLDISQSYISRLEKKIISSLGEKLGSLYG
jgi:RNA polymerase sporulation-specific sigma factor